MNGKSRFNLLYALWIIALFCRMPVVWALPSRVITSHPQADASLIRAWQQARYNVTPLSKRGFPASGAFATNPAQDYQARFTAAGLALSRGERGKIKTGSWNLWLQLRSVRTGALKNVSAPNVTVHGASAFLRHDALLESYDNTARGLRHNLAVPRPVGALSANVELTFTATGNLRPRVVNSATVDFVTNDAKAALHYGDWQARDARGRILPLRLSALNGTGDIALNIATQGATFPLAISALLFSADPLTTPDSAGELNVFFGSSIALSGDTAVVGTYLDDTNAGEAAGAAYVFKRGDTGWTLQAKLADANGESFDQFGYSVALSGDTLVVGEPFGTIAGERLAGAAYVFTRAGGNWTLQAKLYDIQAQRGDYFGWSVAVNGDLAVVGAPGDDKGAAHVFARRAGQWAYEARLASSTGLFSENAGWSVAVQQGAIASGTVPTVLSGAPCAGPDARRFSGAVYVYTRSGATWNRQATLAPADLLGRDNFGQSVALSGDTALVGAPGVDGAGAPETGATYVFTGKAANWGQQAKWSPNETGARFGWSVGLDADTAIVGAPGDGSSVDTGAAHVYRRASGAWTAAARLSPSGGGSRFGWSVAAYGATLAVGARGGTGSASAHSEVFATTDINIGHIVTNTNDSGPGSLRAALTYANAHAPTRVIFNIPGDDPGYAGGAFVIQPHSELPALSVKGTILDGASQTIFTGDSNPNGPEIAIDGALAGNANGLVLSGSKCTVQNVAIAHFSGNGMLLRGTVGGHSIWNCSIGLDAAGNAAGNGGDGILLQGGTNTNSIGSTAGLGNVIAFNSGAGIEVRDAATIRNRLRGNAIYANGGLGINLVGGSEDIYGVTANDAGDADSGANQLQNFPVISQAVAAPNQINVYGAVSGAPNTKLTLDLYRTPVAADPSGYGEGQFYVSSTTVTTSAGGTANFTLSAPVSGDGQYFSVTATDNLDNTSEFSLAVSPVSDVIKPALFLDAPLDETSYLSTPQVVGRASDGETGLARVTCSLYRPAWGNHAAGYWDWQNQVWMPGRNGREEGNVTTANAWADWTMNLPSLEAGSYTVRVHAVDLASNFEDKQARFYIGAKDTAPPSVWIDIPTPNGNHAGLVTAVGRAADAGSGVFQVWGYLYRYAGTGQTAGYWDWTLKKWTPTLTAANKKLTTTSDNWAHWSLGLPTLPLGQYAVGAIAYDYAGLSTKIQVNMIGGPDTTKPAINLDEPLNNGRYSALPAARGRAFDGGTGLKRVIVQIYRYTTTSNTAGFWDWSLGTWNTNSASWQLATTGDNWANWTVALPPLAVGGEYKITARAFDVAGNFESAPAQFRMVAAAIASPAPLNGTLQLSSASLGIAPCQVILKFTGPLNSASASAPENYAVTVRAANGALHQSLVQQATCNNDTVILNLADGAWQAGDSIQVTWQGLGDAHGLPVSGHTGWLPVTGK